MGEGTRHGGVRADTRGRARRHLRGGRPRRRGARDPVAGLSRAACRARAGSIRAWTARARSVTSVIATVHSAAQRSTAPSRSPAWIVRWGRGRRSRSRSGPHWTRTGLAGVVQGADLALGDRVRRGHASVFLGRRSPDPWSAASGAALARGTSAASSAACSREDSCASGGGSSTRTTPTRSTSTSSTGPDARRSAGRGRRTG